ncbi:DDE-type integrase/transposase/recombinase [Corynebacterium pyruviciproducens]
MSKARLHADNASVLVIVDQPNNIGRLTVAVAQADVEHRQIKYRNNVIECDHGKLKRIIGATLGFKSMKTAYATIKGIEVMRALRKGQASAFYYGDPLGEMRLVSRVFEM